MTTLQKLSSLLTADERGELPWQPKLCRKCNSAYSAKTGLCVRKPLIWPNVKIGICAQCWNKEEP